MRRDKSRYSAAVRLAAEEASGLGTERQQTDGVTSLRQLVQVLVVLRRAHCRHLLITRNSAIADKPRDAFVQMHVSYRH